MRIEAHRTALGLAALLALTAGCAGGAKRGPVSAGKPAPAPPTAAAPGPAPPPATAERQGIYHTLGRGQTLYGLSRTYNVPVSTLTRVNGISDPSRIAAGTKIFIPGASKLLSTPVPAAPRLAWPLNGNITSRFGRRRNGSRHTGIDIDGTQGQRIRAAADGRVVKADTGRGYGLMVVIDHGGGLTTLYAHASKLLVFRGERVKKGDPIAKVGRSGNASGSHLHFEVRTNDRPVDPALYINGK